MYRFYNVTSIHHLSGGKDYLIIQFPTPVSLMAVNTQEGGGDIGLFITLVINDVFLFVGLLTLGTFY